MRLGACRIKETKPEDILSITEIFADKICSGFNQHIIIVIEGPTGSGKSNAALDLAHRCSVEFAVRLGGLPEDYFSIGNVAIISGDEVVRLAKNLNRYGIYIMDDIGAEGLSSRKWQSDINDVLTRILQTFRTQNNLLIMTVPDKGFIDKIARNLMHYKIVMGEAWFKKGISTGKLSTVRRIYSKDSGAHIYPFIKHRGITYNACVFQLPPEHIRSEYEEVRRRVEEEIRKKSITEYQESVELADNKRKSAIARASGDVEGWHEKAVRAKIENPTWTIKQVAKYVNKPISTVGGILKKHNLGSDRLTVLG